MKKLQSFLRKNQISWIQVKEEIMIKRDYFNFELREKIDNLGLTVVELDTYFAIY
ncbi:MAG: hypothetical protein IPP05_22345 [Cytophagaceae bacterium]|nr:hypothetical protein [Cytophagaceae bacterium]